MSSGTDRPIPYGSVLVRPEPDETRASRRLGPDAVVVALLGVLAAILVGSAGLVWALDGGRPHMDDGTRVGWAAEGAVDALYHRDPSIGCCSVTRAVQVDGDQARALTVTDRDRAYLLDLHEERGVWQVDGMRRVGGG